MVRISIVSNFEPLDDVDLTIFWHSVSFVLLLCPSADCCFSMREFSVRGANLFFTTQAPSH